MIKNRKDVSGRDIRDNPLTGSHAWCKVGDKTVNSSLARLWLKIDDHRDKPSTTATFPKPKQEQSVAGL